MSFVVSGLIIKKYVGKSSIFTIRNFQYHFHDKISLSIIKERDFRPCRRGREEDRRAKMTVSVLVRGTDVQDQRAPLSC